MKHGSFVYRFEGGMSVLYSTNTLIFHDPASISFNWTTRHHEDARLVELNLPIWASEVVECRMEWLDQV
jgi:hypothetical protein